jgi:iron complex outermembrane receptor protein
LKKALFFISLFCCIQLGQIEAQTDSVINVQEVVVKGFESNVRLLQVPTAISVLNKQALQRNATYSLLPAFNNIAGVRMEERSPGSYRLSIRGSLLRSPFGVRNVKLYLDDFLLTDAGGNTYLNLLDVNNISRAEVLKGPAGSIYGAGTGGAVLLSGNSLMNEQMKDTSAAQIKFAAGSFGTFHQSAQFQKNTDAYILSALQTHSQSRGYRDQSRLQKDNIQLRFKLKENRKLSSDFLVLLSRLNYQTPGGLNQAQVLANPKQSRPATPTLPSAQTQKAQIFNTTALFGFSNTYQLSDKWKTVTSFSTSYTAFKNPFITNYEKRNEINLGIRTKLVYEQQKGIPHQWITGIEVQRGDYSIDSTGNKAGVPDANLVRDDVKVKQQFVFSQFNVDPFDFLKLQAGFSYNYFGYNIERTIGIPSNGRVPITFGNQFLPRFAMSIIPSKTLTVYAQVSKGYSSPTIAEIRPSAGGTFTGLQAEYGWNKELGFKWSALQGKLFFSTAVFQFDLKDAIVRQTNQAGAEYFTNAGAVIQKGLEAEFNWILLNRVGTKTINYLQFFSAYTLNDFKFGEYRLGTNNFKGNKLTGVPEEVVIIGLNAELFKHFYFNLNFNYTGSMPLNDANTVKASAYRLWQNKIGWRGSIKSKAIDIFLLTDNLRNEQYSLGNDINAFGGRFFNPAPGRNFLLGCSINL